MDLTKDRFDKLIQFKFDPTVTPEQVVINLLNFALFFVAVIAIVFIVWGGVQFVVAGGEPDKVTKAKNTLLYAILGIIVIALAFVIVNWAGGTFNPTKV